jgi:DNA-binding transcriptional MerR regulator
MPRPARYTIRAACALTGINPNTLRAWERRHGLVRPERTPSGYRLYTEHDLDRLRHIQGLLDSGLSIGEVTSRLRRRDPERAESTNGGEPAAGLAEPAADAPTAAGIRARDRLVESMLRVACRSDCTGMLRVHGRAVGLLSAIGAFDEVLLPVLRHIDNKVAEKNPHATEAREAAISFARARVHALLAAMKPLHQLPYVACVYGCGPKLEYQLMRLANALGNERTSVLFLGGDTPGTELCEAVRLPNLRVVVMTCERPGECSCLSHYAREVGDMGDTRKLLLISPVDVKPGAPHAERVTERLPEDPLEAATIVLRYAKR